MKSAARVMAEYARLRQAIIADVSEDMQMIDELTDVHLELIEAWNALPGVVPIGDDDLPSFDDEDD